MLKGPEGTPYEGGTWELELQTPENFPQTGFNAKFRTKIFHPNVGSDGSVCVDRLKDGWDPANWSVGEIINVSFPSKKYRL